MYIFHLLFFDNFMHVCKEFCLFSYPMTFSHAPLTPTEPASSPQAAPPLY